MVEAEGFEPSKHVAADLQSAGFDRSPTLPKQLQQQILAEVVRFELTDVFQHRRFSRPVHSTALPHFRILNFLWGFWKLLLSLLKTLTRDNYFLSDLTAII